MAQPASPPHLNASSSSGSGADRLAEYVVLEQTGRGSYGRVNKARHRATGTIVAMKFIDKKQRKEKEIAGIRREIEILTSLQHENIILMHDAFETENEFVVVMEYARGELYDILEDDKSLPEAQVRAIAKQLVRALHYLHMNRVIHRDLKPQNILIGRNGAVRLADFGFSRVLSPQTVVLTSIKGTPLYMAPELVQEQPYNFSVDLWSLGCILYELYYSKPPFFTQNIYQLIDQIKKDPVRLPEPISPEFKSLLRGLLTKNAAQRLNWSSGLLAHPFVADTPQDAMARTVAAAHSRGVRQKLETLGCIRVCRQFTSATATAAGSDGSPASAASGSPHGQQILGADDPQRKQQSQQQQQQKRMQQAEAALSSARMSLRNSISLRMEKGFSRMVLDAIKSPSVEPAQLLEALTLAEQSTLTVVVNPLHSSVFLTRLSQDFFTRLVQIIGSAPDLLSSASVSVSQGNNVAAMSGATVAAGGGGGGAAAREEQEAIFSKALSLLRLFVHPEGAASLAPFPSRAIHEEAVSLLRLRAECRIELNVRQMAKQAVLDNNRQGAAAIRALLLCAAAQPIAAEKRAASDVGKNATTTTVLKFKHVDNKGYALAVLLQVARGSAEGAALVAQCDDFFPCMHAMFEQKLFFGSCSESSDFAPWRPVAVQFLVAMGGYWDLRDCIRVINDAVTPDGAAAFASSSSSSSDAELGYRAAIVSLMQSILLQTEQKLAGGSRAGTSSAGGGSAHGGSGGAPLGSAHGAPVAPLQAPPGSSAGVAGGAAGAAADKTLFTFGPQHLQFVLRLVESVLSRPRAVVSSRPCGNMFGLPDAGLLDDAVRCISAVYRAATTAAMMAPPPPPTPTSANGPASPNTSIVAPPAPVGECVIGTAVTAPLLASGAPFYECDGGAFHALLAILLGGSCDATVPGFDLSPVGTRYLLRAISEAAAFQLHLSPVRSLSCLLECAPLAMLPADGSAGGAGGGGGGGGNDGGDLGGGAMCTAIPAADQSIAAIGLVTRVLSADWIQALEWWPSECGGGLVGARSVVHLTVELLMAAQQQPAPAASSSGSAAATAAMQSQQQQQQVDAADAARISSSLQSHLLKERLFERLFGALDRLSVAERGNAFALATKLVMASPAFVASFVDAGGLLPARMQSLLLPHSPCRGDALSVLCHLSRNSKDVYAAIHDANIYAQLLQIVQSDASDVLRGRVCNLVGNLCKHNASLYAPLKQSGLIAEMVNRCSAAVEPDEGARKFACFAVGNAAFHSEALYPELARSVPFVVRLLVAAEDDKTRQNAAGALGNLVRNGAQLVPALAEHRAVQELVNTLAARESSSGLKKIIVFSLGTLAQLDPCRALMNAAQIHAALSAPQTAAAVQGDVTFAKYVSRLKAKLPAA